MTAAAAFASLKSALMEVYGTPATLVGDCWRQEVTVCLQAGWNGASSGGIDVERIEPTALVATTDVVAYEFGNGSTLEIGDDTYRIVAKAADDMGVTTLTLAKQ